LHSMSPLHFRFQMVYRLAARQISPSSVSQDVNVN
jgi:hypothetical protein